MEDDFYRCIDIVFEFEGYISNDPVDLGGLTKYGISQKYHPNIDVMYLTKHDAYKIYRNEYWNVSGCNELRWPLCLVHFDTAVNCGIGVANNLLSLSNGKWDKYLDLRIKHYYKIVENKPKQVRFLDGWLNRVNKIKEICNAKSL